MQDLSPRQKQVLQKMRSSNNMAEQFHSFYLIYNDMHNFSRMFDYQVIAYYLYQNQRKIIEQYYLNRYKQEKDDDQKAYYQKLCAFLKRYNQQVSSYEYSEDEIATKDKLFYEKQSAREQAQRQKTQKKQAMHGDTIQWKFSSLWKQVCQRFKKNGCSAQEYDEGKNLKQI